jgi:hypothetical protein
VANDRKKVTCVTKSNIMKLTDGLFESIFHDVAREYPGIRAEHMIVDIGAARLAADPASFDVMVLPNLYVVSPYFHSVALQPTVDFLILSSLLCYLAFEPTPCASNQFPSTKSSLPLPTPPILHNPCTNTHTNSHNPEPSTTACPTT